jgi:cytochrome c-type biogenesis protein CcmE
MNPVRKRKLMIIGFVVSVLMLATLLVLYALRQNMSLFFSPTQVFNHEAPMNHPIRMGGMVLPGSIHRQSQSLDVEFDVTDYQHTVHITYHGVLPDLFREGQGVVAQGALHGDAQSFVATEILAKHDENYMPPEVKAALSHTVKSGHYDS